MAPGERHPIYSTTFTLHRLSPLYTGSSSPLTNLSLDQYARSFRDILAGEVLRGVRVGLGSEEDVLARVGSLQTVTWELLSEDDEDVDIWGTVIKIGYERALYSALLLTPEAEGQRQAEDGFQHFPLLLTRMPNSLRETLIDFLSTTFDTRVSKLHFGKAFLIQTLENYIEQCSTTEDGEATTNRALVAILNSIHIVIGFEGISELSSVEIIIDKPDVPRLVETGKRIAQGADGKSPLSAALERYIQSHLALNLTHERVRLLRVACGAFTLGVEGKVKLTEPVGGDEVWKAATAKLLLELAELAK